MSEREYKRVTRQLKPFLTLFIVVMGTAFLASCGGGGSTDPTTSSASADGPTVTAQGVSGSATVPGSWKGRVPNYLKPIENKPSIHSSVYGDVHPSRLTVYLKPGFIQDNLQALAKSNSWEIVSWIPDQSTYSLDLKTQDSRSYDAAIAILKSSGIVSSVSPVGARSVNAGTSTSVVDPGYSLTDYAKTWNFDSIKIPLAWQALYESAIQPSPARIGLIDQGFRLDHEDKPVDTILSGNGSNPDSSHGMHVAGIVGARRNEYGIRGVVWNTGGGEIAAIDASKGFPNEEVTRAIESLLSRGNSIINFSFGASSTSCEWYGLAYVGGNVKCKTLLEATNLARGDLDMLLNIKKIVETYERSHPGKSVLFVHSSGNYGRFSFQDSNQKYTAELNGVFALGASRLSGLDAATVEFFKRRVLVVGGFHKARNGARVLGEYTNLPDASEASDYPFILAPGGNDSSPTSDDPEVYSDLNSSTSSYGFKSGTSMAAPHVTGTAALMSQANDQLNGQEIKYIITQTADTNLGIPFKDRKTGDGSDGYRYLNAEAAVKEAIRRKVEVNCGTITSPAVSNQQGPTYIVISNRATRFSTLPTPKPNYPFGAYRWKTSEGTEILSTIEQANITFYVSSGASIRVTPVLMDGTVCTGSTKTSNVDVNIPEWKINPANNHRYEVISCGTWLQCRDNASALGGKLVTIRSHAENNWLAANFSMTARYWMGAYYDTTTRAWKWASSEPFVFSNWGNNLNNSGGDQYCSLFFPPVPGYWYDVRCSYEYSTKAIIEYMN